MKKLLLLLATVLVFAANGLSQTEEKKPCSYTPGPKKCQINKTTKQCEYDLDKGTDTDVVLKFGSAQSIHFYASSPFQLKVDPDSTCTQPDECKCPFSKCALESPLKDFNTGAVLHHPAGKKCQYALTISRGQGSTPDPVIIIH